jgi:dihydrofolate reductase/thymidylate synthase
VKTTSATSQCSIARVEAAVVSPPAFAIVVAADQDRGIGRENDLPWPKLPGDLAHFKRLTTMTRDHRHRNAVIMGRRTWDSVPPRYRPLAGRLNVVVSHGAPLVPDGVHVATSLDRAIATATAAQAETIYVVGGGQLYRDAVADPRCAVIYYTRIDGRFPCDTFFPPFEDAFAQVASDPPITEGGITYVIERWDRLVKF